MKSNKTEEFVLNNRLKAYITPKTGGECYVLVAKRHLAKKNWNKWATVFADATLKTEDVDGFLSDKIIAFEADEISLSADTFS